MDGTRPKMSNAWKQNMYSIYERTITEQMSTLGEKRKKAVQKAREREREKKEALKLLKAEKAKGKVTSTDNTFVEADSPDVVQDNVTSSEENIDNGKTTATVADNVSSSEITPEDLSFAHFVSILGKRDSNNRYNSDAEAMWEKFPVDVKRKALDWVQGYVSRTPNMNSRQFPYSLLTSHQWNMLGA